MRSCLGNVCCFLALTSFGFAAGYDYSPGMLTSSNAQSILDEEVADTTQKFSLTLYGQMYFQVPGLGTSARYKNGTVGHELSFDASFAFKPKFGNVPTLSRQAEFYKVAYALMFYQNAHAQGIYCGFGPGMTQAKGANFTTVSVSKYKENKIRERTGEVLTKPKIDPKTHEPMRDPKSGEILLVPQREQKRRVATFVRDPKSYFLQGFLGGPIGEHGFMDIGLICECFSGVETTIIYSPNTRTKDIPKNVIKILAYPTLRGGVSF